MTVLEIAGIGIAGAFAYIIAGGFTWALVPESWQGENYYDVDWRVPASIFWPAVLVAWCVYRIATIGPRAVEWHRHRNRLPRAEVRR